MLRKKIIEKVGYFNTQLRAAEDVDLWLRINQNSHLGYIDEPLASWNNYRSNLTSNSPSFFKHAINYYKSLLTSRDVTKGNRKALRRRIAAFLFNFGYYHADKGNLREARKCFRESFGYYPMDVRCIKSILLTSIPETFYYFLRTFKHRIDRNGK